MSTEPDMPFFQKVKHLLLGKARDLNDPHIFHHLSLIAFFAWVGLGADGLSSSCYGPEESFLALQGHSFLGIFVAIATAVTIFIVTSSYSQIVELFPGGGGGYVVASKLLSPTVGMISGCALIIDYVLTIALSIASGTDAIFSLLPLEWQPFKLSVAMGVVCILILLNLRGIKESVVPLIPIFLFFLATHAFVIIYSLATHFSDVNGLVQTTAADVRRTSAELGFAGMLILIMRAYSMGAGTYTGIEAVSNGIPILREPKIKTAKRTMQYMAVSLAFMAVGLMLGYLLYKVVPYPGKTLNAVLFERMTIHWNAGAAAGFVLAALVSEAVLLFVAAQTGFLDGPRVIANMAIDRWLPVQFGLLSERFVIKHGILLMGGLALVIMFIGRASVKFLIILYSINVFITFTLSQLGMVRHWWRMRGRERGWVRKIGVNGIGFILTGFILVSVLALKFNQGGWITLVITGSLAGVAVFVKRYYYRTQKHLKRLDKLVHAAEVSVGVSLEEVPNPPFDPESKTAVVLVNGFNGSGLHTLLNAIKLFSGEFRNFVFVQAGVIDAEHFKGKAELEGLKRHVDGELGRYVKFMKQQGYHAEANAVYGTDVAHDISALAHKIFKKYPRSIFFGGQIVFPEETFLNRLLYNHTTFAVQRRLHRHGIPFIVMPIQISG